MSYPGYPSQNPPYPSQHLPYPTDPMNQGNFGFPNVPYPTQQPSGFTAIPSYPPMDPSFASAPAAPSAYPPMQHGFATNPTPYPSSAPYPGMGAPGYPPANPSYPSANPGYPPANPGYPSNQSGQPMPSYPPAPVYPSHAPNPVQHAMPAYPSQQPVLATQQPVIATQAYSSQSSQGSKSLYPSVKSQGTAVHTKKTPTIVPKQPFNPRQEAEILRKAMKGFGTDEKAIISVLSQCTNQQRIEILGQYKALFGKDLIKDLKSELGGKFEQVVLAAMTPIPEFLAAELNNSITGVGTNEATLIEILCTMNNAWIHAINAQYLRMYGKSLESDIKGDTSGAFQRLLVSLCQGRRDENPLVDINAAVADAHTLYKSGAAKLGTDESTFNMILASRSKAQLCQVFMEYEKLTGKSMESAIKSEFSGSIETGLLAIVKCMRNCPEYYAERLYSAMSGLGTNDRALIRIIVVRAEFDLGDIKAAFQTKYKKTLASFIEGDASGDYMRMLLAMIS